MFLQIFFLYPAGNFVVLRWTYFEQMAHWLARERNYYCCIKEVKSASFWLLSAEPTEIVVKKDVLGTPYLCWTHKNASLHFARRNVCLTRDLHLCGYPQRFIDSILNDTVSKKKLKPLVSIFLSFAKDTYENLYCVGGFQNYTHPQEFAHERLARICNR